MCVARPEVSFNDNTIWEEAACSSLTRFQRDAGKCEENVKHVQGQACNKLFKTLFLLIVVLFVLLSRNVSFCLYHQGFQSSGVGGGVKRLLEVPSRNKET